MHKTQSFKKRMLVTAVASVMANFAAPSFAQDDSVEEVVVTGIRGSLERSIDIKRNASNLVEAITASDIGKMPDQNVAESLQRLPGVQIDRQNGEGTKVRIRGLDQNITLLNGETFTSGLEYFQLGEARTEFDSSLEGVPSELLGGVEVYKTPKASMVEGGMGGVVNLKTRDSLSINEPLLAGNIKMDQGKYSEDAQPSGVLVIGNNWNDKFGAILSLTASKKTVHSDQMQSFSRENTAVRCTEGASLAADLTCVDGGGDIVAGAQSYLVPGMWYVNDSEFERERVGGSLNLQWQVNDAVQLGLDYFHADLNVVNTQNIVKHAMNTDGSAGIDESQPYVITQSAGQKVGILRSGTILSPSGETNVAGEVSDAVTDNYLLTLKVDNGDAWRFTGKLGGSESELDQRSGYGDSRFSPYGLTTWVGTGAGGNVNGWAHVNPNNGPAGYTGPTNRPFSYATGEKPNMRFADSSWLSNPDFFTFKSYWALGSTTDQSSNSISGDFEYDIDMGDLKKLSFGVRAAEKQVEFNELRYMTDYSRTSGVAQPNKYDANGNLVSATNYNPAQQVAAGGVGIAEATYYDLCGNGGLLAGNECDIDGDGLDDNQGAGPWGYFTDAGIGLKAFDLTTSNGTPMAQALYGLTQPGQRFGNSPGVIPWQTYAMNQSRYSTNNDFFPSGGYQSTVLTENASAITKNVTGWIDGLTPDSPGQWFQVPLESWDITETTTALYAEADFEGDSVPYTLNIGARLVKTEVESKVAETTPESSLWSIATDGWNSQGVLLDWDVVTKKTDYWDVLPSLNFVLNTTDDTKLRFSAAKVIARPNLQSLGKGFGKNFTRTTDSQGDYFAYTGGSSGNPLLDPYRATQADVGFEWYMDDLSMVSVGAFVKAVDSFIQNETRLEFGDDARGGSLRGVNRPQNGSGGSVSGLEFSIQQGFDSGFGYSFNYTFSDSKTDTSTTLNEDIGLPGISENAFNLMGYYEVDAFSARVSYTWRDDYLSPYRSVFAVTGLAEGAAEYFNDYGQWDASFQYNISENVSVSAELLNITGEASSSYLGYPGIPMTYTNQEPRAVLGVSFKL